MVEPERSVPMHRSTRRHLSEDSGLTMSSKRTSSPDSGSIFRDTNSILSSLKVRGLLHRESNRLLMLTSQYKQISIVRGERKRGCL